MVYDMYKAYQVYEIHDEIHYVYSEVIYSAQLIASFGMA